MLDIPFGARLRELRLERKLTLSQVAEKIGVAKTSYAGYEKNYRHPPMDKLLLLSELFEVSVDYILCKTDERKGYTQNAREYLRNKDLHWDGMPLTEAELQTICDILESVMIHQPGTLIRQIKEMAQR